MMPKETAKQEEGEEVEEEEKLEKVKKPKAKKEKAPKRKKVRKKISALYKVEGKNLQRLLPFCERCGPGYFMADHGNRYACGHCGFTQYKPTEPFNKASSNAQKKANAS
jgi:small subunit ribosomal protein S27Ae